jgi:hypothetical protein
MGLRAWWQRATQPWHRWRHRWQTVREDVGRVYQVCRDCGERRVDFRYGVWYWLESRHPTDRLWLETGVWSEDWKIVRQPRTWY